MVHIKKIFKNKYPFLLQWTVASFAVHCDLICLIILDHLGTSSGGPEEVLLLFLHIS